MRVRFPKSSVGLPMLPLYNKIMLLKVILIMGF